MHIQNPKWYKLRNQIQMLKFQKRFTKGDSANAKLKYLIEDIRIEMEEIIKEEKQQGTK